VSTTSISSPDPRIRSQSAFCLSTILAVAKVAEDPGGEWSIRMIVDRSGVVSETQSLIRKHAENIAKDTMFTDADGLDIVQGLGASSRPKQLTISPPCILG
jgi:hypothetical protein